jgi:hypothetical protein
MGISNREAAEFYYQQFIESQNIFLFQTVRWLRSADISKGPKIVTILPGPWFPKF